MNFNGKDNGKFLPQMCGKGAAVIDRVVSLSINKQLTKRMTEKIMYKGRVSHKPLKDYFVDEIEPWHIECVNERLREFKSMANQLMHLICTIYKWALWCGFKKWSIKIYHQTANEILN